MSSSSLEGVCGQLAEAAELMTNPSTPKDRRIEAFKEIETFKESSPLVLDCAFYLMGSSADTNPIIRIFGLKILEDSIKIRWNDLNPQEKLKIKENVMSFIATAGISGTNSPPPQHIKDGISRCVVEIVKREWPQHWPTFLGELNDLSRKGELETEIVMLILLRLIEDVAVLQTLEQTQRRKEIYHGLTNNMEEIFGYLLGLLEKHYKLYLGSSMEDGKKQTQVCKAVLDTFNALVDWVPMNHIMGNDKYLIRCLCHLLSDDTLKLAAAEVLLNIVSAKQSKMQDKVRLLCLFDNEMIAPLFSAIEAAEKSSLEKEDHYIFLKKMVQILTELGSQLCSIWASKENKQTRPSNFDTYLNALLFFTVHPSHTVNHFANELWTKFFRHSDISKDDLFKTYVPKWLDAVLRKVVKISTMNKNSPAVIASSNYSILDFETDEELNGFFGRYRIIILEGVKLISANYTPQAAFEYTNNWLRGILSRPIDVGQSSKNGMCTQTSPSYGEIDAIAIILDSVLSGGSKWNGVSMDNTILGPTLDLLKIVLDYQTRDPLLNSVLLSCVSSMFIAVTHTPPALLPVMNKIFSCITFTNENKEDSSLDNVVLRRHGCSLLVKISFRYPSTLFPIFNHLRDTIVNLQVNDQITKMEFSSLVESLVLISNEFKNYSTQSEFINSIATLAINQFKSCESIFNNTIEFIKHVGFDQINSPITDVIRSNRCQVSFCIVSLLNILRRSGVPSRSDLDVCRSEGFLLFERDGIMALRNPASPIANSVLPLIFYLTKTLNSLWDSQYITKYNYSQLLGMVETEINVATGNDHHGGNINNSIVRTPQYKSQLFLVELFENVHHLLNEYCVTLGHDFYSVPGLANGIISYVFQGFPIIPDYRLRLVVKMFLKNLVNKCPKSHFSTVLAPVLETLCPYMLNRLIEKWKYLETIRQTPSDDDEDNRDSQEVIDDFNIRQMTRDYLDVIKAILTSGGGSDVKIIAEENESNSGGNNNQLVLSELGSLVLLTHESLRQTIVSTLLRALVWFDSSTSVRSCYLLELVIPTLTQACKLSTDEARQIMISILSAIHDLGQHELNYISLTQLAIQAYEWMRPSQPCIVDILAQVPGCNQDDLKRFDERILACTMAKENGGGGGGIGIIKGGDRAKKEMFKKVISQFIGKDIAQMFKKEVIIKNLPSIKPDKPKKTFDTLDNSTSSAEIGLTSLFNNENK